jgi:hypothetical protein
MQNSQIEPIEAGSGHRKQEAPPAADAAPPATKRCSRCREVKPVSEFSANSQCNDGLAWYCRRCRSIYTRDWQRQHPEYMRARRRRYRRRRCEAAKAYAARPENVRRFICVKIAQLAVKAGIIPREHNCEHCGVSDQEAKLQRHHTDYSRPLYVIWLCTSCHGKVHRKWK